MTEAESLSDASSYTEVQSDDPQTQINTQQSTASSSLSLDASDFEAVAESVFTPLNDDLEVETQGWFTWTIRKWSVLEDRVKSEPFECGGFDWRILLFPRGNHSNSDSCSLFLECTPHNQSPPSDEDTDMDPSVDPYHACAQFGLVMWNPEHPTAHCSHSAYHRFNEAETDWGFAKFRNIRSLFSTTTDIAYPLIEHDSTNISAYIRIFKDETGVLWHNFINYDSRQVTGYVGLRNQGATCYLNSLVQSLYCTNAFRKAVYQIPTEDDDPVKSVPLALQRLFYLLQTSPYPVSTTELTKSFGWDTADAFTQHDVQELNRVLMDNLEGKMKGTPAEKALASLFAGKMKSYIRCINVDFESSRTEEFWDIQLNVKGMKDLKQSFQDYVQVETLDGENQYQASEFGLQDAHKGVVFQSFPPVLHLQLKRFEYDFMCDTMVKINDRHEFPLEIDLEEYLSDEADKSEPAVYCLHGVLVHSGDLNVGHYYTLIKPTVNGDWLKFDDDRVTRATMKEVLNDNYGGDVEDNSVITMTGQRQTNISRYIKRHSNAYMLVYLRKSRLQDILEPITEADVPAYIPALLEQQKRAEELRRKELEEQHLYMTIKVANIDTFKKYQGFDITSWSVDAEQTDMIDPEALPKTFRMLKTSTVTELKNKVSEVMGYNSSTEFMMWLFSNRMNKTARPDQPVPENTSLDIEQIREKKSSKCPDFRLWIDTNPEVLEKFRSTVVNPATQPLPDNSTALGKPEKPGRPIFLLLKYFDVENQTLLGLTTTFVDLSDSISTLVPVAQEALNLSSDVELKMYEEIKPDLIEELNFRNTFEAAELRNGDIITVAKSVPNINMEKFTGYKDAINFYRFLLSRTRIHFLPRFDDEMEDDMNEDEFSLVLSKRDDYSRLSEAVGHYLKVDPEHLRFTTCHPSGAPRSIVKYAPSASIASIFSQSYSATPNMLYYEVLPMPLKEMEQMISVPVIYIPDSLVNETGADVLVPKNATVALFLEELARLVNLELKEDEALRTYLVHKGHILGQLDANAHVADIRNGEIICVEKVLRDDMEANTDQAVIEVIHFQKDISHLHGVPFYFSVKWNEKFSEFRARLKKKLGYKDDTFEKVKIACVSLNQHDSVEYITDGESFLGDVLRRGDILGLDHIDTSSRRNHGERAITIRN
ncbi:hypothetical protein CANCADRAFT_137158 [Tortispora caseinolytica NRRL Y-17796]|uniref:ubiquitinyl hydrolase 1 n=1 Tax=Tortispora caseinolytica NRRL Y-17796 TaxID=767744 RepID=A0A1E4TCE2_9ASCO|nr:hypothetical protein CANCADRAFT_137158 [Tortispora caseinolytica NRRL Y-17796]